MKVVEAACKNFSRAWVDIQCLPRKDQDALLVAAVAAVIVVALLVRCYLLLQSAS